MKMSLWFTSSYLELALILSLTEVGMLPSFEDEELEAKWLRSSIWTSAGDVTDVAESFLTVVFLDAVTTKCKIDGRLQDSL